MTAMTSPIAIQPGDTVESLRTGEVAQVVDMSPSILTLESETKGRWNDPASYWRRTVCPDMHP